jgi:hypothetical protein
MANALSLEEAKSHFASIVNRLPSSECEEFIQWVKDYKRPKSKRQMRVEKKLAKIAAKLREMVCILVSSVNVWKH